VEDQDWICHSGVLLGVLPTRVLTNRRENGLLRVCPLRPLLAPCKFLAT